MLTTEQRRALEKAAQIVWDNGYIELKFELEDILASAAPAEVDNWQQYAKEGETAQQCIERHRAEQDALLKLYGRAAPAAEAAAYDVAYANGNRGLVYPKELAHIEKARIVTGYIATPLYFAPQPASEQQAARGLSDDDDCPSTPASERAAFNASLRWHLIRLLQAWRYGGDMSAVALAAFEWARTNSVGKEAFKASERAVKLAAKGDGHAD